MSLENLLEQLPEYAKDLRLNLSSMMNNHNDLTEDQFWGAILVSAIASRNIEFLKVVRAEAESKLSADAIKAANAAASIMAMNNIYYRFTHLVSNKEYSTMPAGLRMNIMREITNKADFELWSFAVSVINGCGMCIDSHEKQLVKHEINKESTQLVAKIAAVVHAVAVTLETQ